VPLDSLTTQPPQRSSPLAGTALLAAGAAAFVCISGRSLPDTVGSHFAASGNATGFLPRALYLRLTLIFVVLLPLAINLVASLSLRSVNARVNIPNRDYWLAPERKAESVEFVRRQIARFSAMLMVFICYVHWLVVRANALTPPLLSSPWFMAGLIAFLVSALLWATNFLRRFRAVA
jgi:hypothetical protein